MNTADYSKKSKKMVTFAKIYLLVIIIYFLWNIFKKYLINNPDASWVINAIFLFVLFVFSITFVIMAKKLYNITKK